MVGVLYLLDIVIDDVFFLLDCYLYFGNLFMGIFVIIVLIIFGSCKGGY